MLQLYGGAEQTVKILLDNEANISIKNREGNTAFDAAVAVNNEKIVRMLLAAGATIFVDDGTEIQFDANNGYSGLARLCMPSATNEVAFDESDNAEEEDMQPQCSYDESSQPEMIVKKEMMDQEYARAMVKKEEMEREYASIPGGDC